VFFFLVFECESAPPKNQCVQKLPILNGRVRLLLSNGVTIAKITCFQPYVLVNGNETMTCIEGKWDSEFPICASKSLYLLIIINAIFNYKSFKPLCYLNRILKWFYSINLIFIY